MDSPIIYTGVGKTIVLLDLPASIQDAQGTGLRIRSTTALIRPHPYADPKGKKLQALLQGSNLNREGRQRKTEERVGHALSALRNEVVKPGFVWCFPRVENAPESRRHAERWAAVSVAGLGQRVDGTVLAPAILSSTEPSTSYRWWDELGQGLVINPSSGMKLLNVGTQVYLVPARSAFVNASISDGLQTLRWAVAHLLSRGWFDLIVMDPPWQNRSVRRSGAYGTEEDQADDPFEQSLATLQYLAIQGIVAIWVTNKSSIRDLVLARLEAGGFSLRQEWLWIKVTSSGEPIFPVDGYWRKPYETLLIFTPSHATVEIPSRTIVAVPDIHSRKPSLKRLFEEILPATYQALEVFARSLTRGWWSWGDQVLKFQEAHHWSREEPSQAW